MGADCIDHRNLLLTDQQIVRAVDQAALLFCRLDLDKSACLTW